MPDRLIIVTPDISPAGGGMATLARLLIPTVQAYCRQHRLRLAVWSLGSPAGNRLKVPVRYFHGSQVRMALALWRASLHRPRPVLLAVHLGLMRALVPLPPALRPVYLVILHGVEVWRPLAHDRRAVLKNAAKLLANSGYTRRRAYEHHPWLGEVAVLRLPLEERPTTGTADPAVLAQAGDGYILIVARLDASQRHKGHDALIDALPLVRQRYPAARLVITGRGTDAGRLKARARELGLADAVVFTGFVDDATLDQLFRRCRVFAMPSTGDGFGFVYLEAMQRRKPCIGLHAASAAEIIQHGETGLLVQQGDPEALAAALLRFLQDPAYAHACGQRGYERLRTHFSQEAFAASLIPHLDAVMIQENII